MKSTKLYRLWEGLEKHSFLFCIINVTSYPCLNPVATSTGGSDDLRMSGDAACTCGRPVVAIGTPSLAPECGVVWVGHRAKRSRCGRVCGNQLQRHAHRAWKNRITPVHFYTEPLPKIWRVYQHGNKRSFFFESDVLIIKFSIKIESAVDDSS